jgi:hypothetical protein
MPSEGPNFGTGSNDNSVGTHAWTTPERISVNDESAAEAMADVFTALDTQRLKASDFNFSIPSDATIVGVEVEIDVHETPFGANPTEYISLVVGGVAAGEEKSGANVSGFVTYGSPTDLWELDLEPADVNSADFGAVYRAMAESALFNHIGIDSITITVHYEEDESSSSVSSSSSSSASSSSSSSTSSSSSVSDGAIDDPRSALIEIPT